MAEVGVADGGGGVFDGVAEGFLFANEDAEAAGAAYAGVEEVAVKHGAVGHRDGEYYVFYFGALEFVYGRGVTEGQFAEFTTAIGAAVAVGILHYHCLLFRIDLDNPT